MRKLGHDVAASYVQWAVTKGEGMCYWILRVQVHGNFLDGPFFKPFGLHLLAGLLACLCLQLHAASAQSVDASLDEIQEAQSSGLI